MGKYLQAPLKDFAPSFEALTLKDFLDHFDCPFILVEKFEEENSKGFRTVMPEDTENRNGDPLPHERERDTGCETVVTLVKSGRNAFKNMISLGRSVNNDIVITHPVVSKLHAYFRYDPEYGTFTITDTGSTNGTFLKSIPLPINEPVPLNNGDVLVIGGILRATFLTAEYLYKYMEALRRLGKV